MSLIVADRIQETTNTTGTGAYTLGGAVAGFQTFASVASDTDTVYYSVTDNVDFEVGLGTYASGGGTITRTTVFSSSNSGSAVNWGIGTKNIFLTYPADKAVLEDASNNVTVGNNLIVGGTVDGVDIAARDAVLTTTTNTANAALPKAGGTMTGNLILNADPTAALQSATKQYVDNIAAAGIHYHQACRAETTANLNATYNNGSSGVGATLTNAGTQAALVLDGVTLVAADRVMIQDQTNAAHNGIYTVTTVGSGSTNWVLTRATDADSYGPSDPNSLGEGDAFFITEGTVHGGELDVMATAGTIVFGTTDIVFNIVADAPLYTAGAGLTLTAQEFSLNTPVSSATALATGRTISLTGDVAGTSGSFDGTGNVSIAATIQANSVALGTDTTGNYVATGAVSGVGLSGSSASEGGTFTVASNATSANTASTIVARDGSGNFSAGTITAALTGNASTATTLQTARTINGVSFNGSANITVADSTKVPTSRTVSAGSGISGGGALSGNITISLESDARGDLFYMGRDTNDYFGVETTQMNWVLDGATDMRLYNSGDLHVEGNVIAYSTTISDERLKTDIVKIDGALDKVAQLNGYTFTYTADGKKSAGVIAQEVQKVLPSAIVESKLPLKMGDDDETEYMTVQYDQLMGLLIEAVKELKAEVAELKGV
jgi:hypothetical protein